jgi:hypothetical protein
MMRSALLAALLLAPGVVTAQDRLQLDREPAASARVPPSEPPGTGRSLREGPPPASGFGDPGRVGIQTRGERRTEPPPGHQVLPAPVVPGATQPRRSEGFATGRDPILARPGADPDAPTTDRGQIREGGGSRR